MKTILISLLMILSGCNFFLGKNHDPQFIQIDLKFDTGGEINTFQGYMVKDLNPGMAKTDFWFTNNEQKHIIAKVDSLGFFNLPDTIDYRPKNLGVASEPVILHIKYGDKDKTVFRPNMYYEDEMPAILRRFQTICNVIMDTAYSKSEYKDLPEVKNFRL